MRSISRDLRLVVVVDLTGEPSPSEIRQRFAVAIREAIMRAHSRGLDDELVEELVRGSPPLEPPRQ